MKAYDTQYLVEIKVPFQEGVVLKGKWEFVLELTNEIFFQYADPFCMFLTFFFFLK